MGNEILKMLSFALITVVLVVAFITANLRITIFVVSLVMLVIIYMTVACHLWGLTLNNIFAINLAFALGIAVDYSVHIAHTYLHEKPPKGIASDKEKREYKVAKAISKMGSSVFHGGFSTLLAVSVLGFARLYTF